MSGFESPFSHKGKIFLSLFGVNCTNKLRFELQYKVNDLSAFEREVEITFSYDEIKKDIDKEVLKQTKEIELSGFRKGKVPLSIIKKMYGDSLEYEASEKLANSKFWEVADEKELNPINQPRLTDIKFKPGEDLYFKVKYEVIPVIEVKDYTGLDIEVPLLEAKEEDVEHELKHILKANSITEDVDTVGEHNNFLINIEVQKVDENGTPIESIKPETLDVDLSNERVNSEIIENARGKKVGDNFKFAFKNENNIKKDDGSEEKKEENFFYTAKLNSIKEIKLPELNEEFIKKVTKDKFSNETELREGISIDVQNYYNQRTDDYVRDKLLNSIIEKNDFDPPLSMIKNALENIIQQEQENYKKSGYGKLNKEEAEKIYYKSAERQVKWYLIKKAIIEKENITVTDEDLREMAKKDAVSTGLPEEKLINYYKSSNLHEKLADKKLFDFLKEKSTVKKINPEDFKNKETKENK